MFIILVSFALCLTLLESLIVEYPKNFWVNDEETPATHAVKRIYNIITKGCANTVFNTFIQPH